MHSLINPTPTSNSLSVFQQYATYTAQQLPAVIFFPDYYNIMAVNNKLTKVGFNPLATVLLEYGTSTKYPPGNLAAPGPGVAPGGQPRLIRERTLKPWSVS